MAGPNPRQSRPPPRPRRSAADVLAGLGAAALLLILLVGVPVALLAVLGPPIPHSMPALSLLTHRLDLLAILRILSVIVWLAWLQLIGCLIAEVRAAVRNTGMPARVPLAGGMQPAVHRLVTATLLLFGAATALSPAFTHHASPDAPGARQAVTSAPARRAGAVGVRGPRPGVGASPAPGPRASPGTGPPGPGGSGARDGEGRAPEPAHRIRRTEKIYVVQPPEGRYHESLWEIAQNHLGDGRRYREVFELNTGRVQPDGSKLTIASLIRPGWILRMPRDAYGPGIKIVTLHEHAAQPGRDAQGGPGAAGTTGPPAAQAGQAQAGTAPIQPGAAGGREPVPGAPGAAVPAMPGATVLPMPRAAVPPMPGAAVPAARERATPAYPYELAAATLLAAGVLSALGRRRREQLWRRAIGRRVAVPVWPAPAAAAEVALRLGANEPSARMLDTGLRYLGQALDGQGRALPTVFAAHLGRQNLDLWVAPADRDAPAPWVAVGDGQVWRLPLDVVPGLDPRPVAEARAPYPGLVSIGTDATGRVLVDLESAQGLIAITGQPHGVRAAVTAMAVELVASRWSGPIAITLVGFGGDLTALAPERVNAVGTLAEALPALAARAELVEESMAASGGGVLTGRAPGPPSQPWLPHFLISAVPPSAAERQQLLTLARTRHAAAGYLITGDVAGAAWTWEVTERGRLRAGVLGLDVRAQMLPPEQHAAMVDLFRAAEQFEGVALAAPLPDAAPAEHLVPGSAAPVEITLLGQVRVNAPGTIEPERLGLATELVAFLATHPGGVHPNVLAAAIWPRSVTREVRDATLARVRDWLGTDDIGRPHLATDASGRLRLGSQARVDWQVFCALVAQAGGPGEPAPRAPAAGGGGPGGEAALEQALGLVSGPFIDGREPGRYAWLASDGLEDEVEARVADAAHLLSQLRLAGGDALGAMHACRAGLRLAFDDELLWRDLLTAAHATGQAHLLRAVVDEVRARTALDEVLPRMAPETEALIDELLPSWRSSAA
jgi:hypothetical protein